MNIVAKGINDAWLQVLRALSDNGKEYSPRGKKIKELKNVSIEIQDPKKRILSLPIRNISLPFAFGELVWYLTGRNDVGMMTYYSKMMKNFSDDGVTLNSAYGYRIFGNHPQLPFNQWEHVVNQLRNDPETRQAIIHLHTPNNKKTKDEVCTLSLQFFIRDGKLDMITNMRSNDIIWGFTYDVFSFTTLQELMANELGVEVGTYYHNAASMHIYDKDYFYLDHLKVYYELMYMTRYDMQFDYEGLTINDPELNHLFELESKLRVSNWVATPKIENKALRVMLDIFNLYAIYKNDGQKQVLLNLKYDNIYHGMMRNYISRTPLHRSVLLIIDGCDGSGKSTLIKKFSDVTAYNVIAFEKPKDFNKLIYFQTALLSGFTVLDRFYYSEWVYALEFKRERIISSEDVKVIESLLNYRKACYIMMNTAPEICFQRLDMEDSKVFSLDAIKRLCDGYELMFRVSDIKDKVRMTEVKRSDETNVF